MLRAASSPDWVTDRPRQAGSILLSGHPRLVWSSYPLHHPLLHTKPLTMPTWRYGSLLDLSCFIVGPGFLMTAHITVDSGLRGGKGDKTSPTHSPPLSHPTNPPKKSLGQGLSYGWIITSASSQKSSYIYEILRPLGSREIIKQCTEMWHRSAPWQRNQISI